MGTILDQLADYARVRVEQAKQERPAEAVRAAAEQRAKETPEEKKFAFEKALSAPIPEGMPGAGDSMHFICECKKASPSKGLIAPDFPYVKIAKDYEAAGASAISCLTEPKWFLGQDAYLEEIARNVQTPLIRKDFTVDPYMIYEAKILGASAVLLICALLDTKTLREYIAVADSLGLSSLVEAHNEEEVQSALDAGARVIGVNNRNLKDFTVDIHNSIRLRNLAPKDKIFVAESGIKTAADIEELRENGVNAVLIGETLMRAADQKAELMALRGRV